MSDQEQYGPAWIRVTVMVHPCGDIHFIGGDRAPGEGDTEYLAAKYLCHASKSKELAATVSQQLQAKIRAIADGLEIAYRTADPMAVDNAVNELRELSAVQ